MPSTLLMLAFAAALIISLRNRTRPTWVKAVIAGCAIATFGCTISSFLLTIAGSEHANLILQAGYIPAAALVGAMLITDRKPNA